MTERASADVPAPGTRGSTGGAAGRVSGGTTRRVVVGLTVAALAPLVAHLTWRALARATGGPLDGVALRLSLAAVAVAALAVGLPAVARSTVAAWGGVVGAALALGALAGGVAGAMSLVLVGGLGVVLAPRMQEDLAAVQGPTSPARLAAWCALMLLAGAASVDLATYLGDAWAPGVGVDRGGFMFRHYCATSYLHAAELARSGVDNVYDLALVPVPSLDAEWLPPSAAHMAPFRLDRYGYPPQFLVAPVALVSVVGDFMAQRAIWSCSSALFLAFALWRLGIWVGPRSGRIARAAAPALWLTALPVFQVGNIQLTVLGLGVLAMVAVHERRDGLGGALLASVTLAKIAPGLLGVVLLLRRRWGAVGWTVLAVVGLTGLSLAVLGTGPFEAFLHYHLPRISSGEAYDFLDDTPRAIFENLSPFGIPFKLVGLGVVSWDPWVWGPRFATAYTVLAFLLTAVAGRRALDRRGLVAVWLLVLTLGALRSPMGPGYLLGGVLWALTLAAAEIRRPAGWAVGAVLIGVIGLSLPFFGENPWQALGAQLVMHGTIAWLMLRRWVVLDEAHPARGL